MAACSENKQSYFSEFCVALQERIGYQFQDFLLLEQALLHRSYLHCINSSQKQSNERLEFLGDSVLNLIVTDFLYQKYPDQEEGFLSKQKSMLVSSKMLSFVADSCSLLHQYMKLGLKNISGKRKENLLANSLEAVIGAVYVDGGFQAAKIIVHQLILTRIEDQQLQEVVKDYKSLLLEWAQAQQMNIEYRILDEQGLDHKKTFVVGLFLNGKEESQAIGSSKKEAERMVSKSVYQQLNLI